MAYEKASIIYQIAATHSAISSAQNRSDPEGLKRAYYYSRTCAGMLTYINDNFLHAPSTDLSRDVIKFLVGITLAQANEIFYETCVDKRQNPTLISKVAANTASLYNGLCEEVKEFFGKGIFDRNWVTLLQVSSAIVCVSNSLIRITLDQSQIFCILDALSTFVGGYGGRKTR